MFDTTTHIRAMQLAAGELGVSQEEFTEMFYQRLLNDSTVPEEIKIQIRESGYDRK